MRRGNIVSLLVISMQFLIGVYFYPVMPEQMAIHWNFRGVADGYSPRVWGLFLLPFISIGLFLLFRVIPKIDPLKNIERFGKYYWGLVILLLVFMLCVESVVISWNLGFEFGMFQVLAPAIGILFYYLGVVTEHAERNWFVGIRTPWTLSNEKVWNKTHRIGGKLFKICGVLAVFGIVSEWLGLLLVIALILCVSVYLTVYSYFEYQKHIHAS